MSTLELLGTTCAVAAGFMTGVWILSLVLKNASIVDIFWGPGFLAVAGVVFGLARASDLRAALLLSLAAIWGLRLAAHVGFRNAGRGEDWRYRKWRDRSPGTFWWRSYFKVFLLQGLILVIVALPLTLGISGSGGHPLGPMEWTGSGLWLLGFLFETIGDEQLRRFKRNPANAGKVMDRGLWRYTRHPNYFGEALLWWGVFMIALPTPYGPWGAVGPALITFLLIRVSGIRMLEAGLADRKPGYADYVRRTSPFIPWVPKRLR